MVSTCIHTYMYFAYNSIMDVSKGFQITEPNVFIPWSSDEGQLPWLLRGAKLQCVTKGYYTANLISFGGLNCMIGFHFKEPNNTLSELEFFRMNYDDQKASFEEFQNYFEAAFGKPTSCSDGSEGFNNYQWLLEDVLIIHRVYDRFGIEEHMRIIKRKNKT
jgi:hypothetical protein